MLQLNFNLRTWFPFYCLGLKKQIVKKTFVMSLKDLQKKQHSEYARDVYFWTPEKVRMWRNSCRFRNTMLEHTVLVFINILKFYLMCRQTPKLLDLGWHLSPLLNNQQRMLKFRRMAGFFEFVYTHIRIISLKIICFKFCVINNALLRFKKKIRFPLLQSVSWNRSRLW